MLIIEKQEKRKRRASKMYIMLNQLIRIR